jgi:purine nucleosidase
MRSKEVREKFTANPLLSAVLAFAEVWFKVSIQMTFHDPLAAVCIFEPDICKYMTGEVAIELGSEKVSGLTHFTAKEKGPKQVAFRVDADRFFEHFFAVTGG